MQLTATGYCEICDRPGRVVEDPGGGMAEMCGPCLKDRRQQVETDARWAELADTE